jgi:hypothetical protein
MERDAQMEVSGGAAVALMPLIMGACEAILSSLHMSTS